MKSILLKTAILIGAPLMFLKPAKAQNSQPLSEFSKLKLDGTAEVELVIADRYSVYREGDNGQALNVVNGELLITEGGGKIRVFTKGLTSVKMDGASKLECLDTIKATDFSLNMDGASRARLIVSCTNINVDLDGGAYLVLEGNGAAATFKADGASQIKAKDFVGGNITAESDGGSKIQLQAKGTLNAKADGVSSITYKGEPANKSFSIDGIAKIKSMDTDDVYDEQLATDMIPEHDGDTTRLKIGSRKFIIIDDEKKEGKKSAHKGDKEKMKRVYAGFELGVNALTTSDMNFSHDANYKYLNTRLGNSWFYGLNLFEVDGHIVKNKLAFTTGLGMQFSNYHFEGDTYLTPNADSLSGTNAGLKLSTNKLYTYDLNAPFLIKFAPGRKGKSSKGFHIAAGAIVHYVASTKVVTETSANGYEQRTKIYDDFNINSFRVDATVRVGYDKVKLFANYSLTPMFNNAGGKNPDIRVFAAGVTLVGF